MSSRVHFLLIVGSIIFLFGVIYMVRKTRLSTDMGCIWIVFSVAIFILALFPNLVIQFGYFIGIISTVNVMFLFMIFLLLCLVFYLFIKVSFLQNRINNLVQIIALLDQKKSE